MHRGIADTIFFSSLRDDSSDRHLPKSLHGAMYKREMEWLRARDFQRELVNLERQGDQLAQCSFTPKINKKSRAISKRKGRVSLVARQAAPPAEAPQNEQFDDPLASIIDDFTKRHGQSPFEFLHSKGLNVSRTSDATAQVNTPGDRVANRLSFDAERSPAILDMVSPIIDDALDAAVCKTKALSPGASRQGSTGSDNGREPRQRGRSAADRLGSRATTTSSSVPKAQSPIRRRQSATPALDARLTTASSSAARANRRSSSAHTQQPLSMQSVVSELKQQHNEHVKSLEERYNVRLWSSRLCFDLLAVLVRAGENRRNGTRSERVECAARRVQVGRE